MKKKLLTMIGLTILGLGLAACGNGNQETATKASSSEPTTIEVTDSNGIVEVPKNPEKVVVFDNGSLDTIDALGVGETVVGAPTENLPSYLDQYKEVESAGGIKEPDLEKINQLQPDLIIISGRQQDFLEDLNKIAPTLYLSVDAADTWTSTKQNIETLGQIFDKEKVADEKITELEGKINSVKQQATDSGQKALVVLMNEGQLSAYGNGSRFGIVHDTFGFAPADETIEASTHGQSVSFEYVLETNPDILFVVDRTKAIGGDDTQNNLETNELVKQTNAGKNSEVITLTPDVWYLSGGGIESTNLMLEDVEKAFK